MNNLPQNQQSHKQNLKVLKQLWASGANEQTIKQTIWSFKNKLPVQYQKPILRYCFSNDFPNTANVFQSASYMFRSIECLQTMQKKISQFLYFYNNQTEVSETQMGVVMYNLASFYEKFGMDAKAQSLISQNKYLLKLNWKLEARIWLKNKLVIKRKNKELQKQMQRFIRIKQTQQNLCYILSLNYITLAEMYNIGLSLKNTKKYRKSIMIMQKVANSAEKQNKLYALSKIISSECYFNLGLIKKAIDTINQLKFSNNFYIIPYTKEIDTKIILWSKSNQILELAKKNKLQKQVSKLIINNQRQKSIQLKQFSTNRCQFKNKSKLDSKTLLQNRKLLFLQDKFEQLDKLKKKHTNINSFNRINHKNFLSLQIYKSPERIKQLKSRQIQTEVKNQHSTNEINFKNSNPQLKRGKKLRRRISRFEQLNNFILLSNINSPNVSNNNSFSSILDSDDGKSRWGDQNFIDHHWAVIKNSKDQAQIAEKYLALGNIYAEQKDFQNALLCYKKALEKGRYEAYGRIGQLYYNKGKSSATQFFQKYLKFVDDSDHQIRLKLLHCYSKIPQKYKKATQQLQQILEKNPYDTQCQILKATILMKQKNYSKAINSCLNFKKINYMCYENHHILGLLYKLVNKNKEAFDSFIDALKVNPLGIYSLVQLTFLTQISDFTPQLISIYKKALRSNKKNHEILQILHNLILKKQVDPQQIKPRLNFSDLVALGDFFIQKQLVQQAEISYKEAGQYTNNTLLKEKFGNLQYLKKNYQQAQKYYKQSQKRKHNFKILIKLGHTLLKQGKFQQAKEILQDCITNQGQSKYICLNFLGQCEFRLGNYQKSLQRFQQSKKLAKNKQIVCDWEHLCLKKIQEAKKKNIKQC